MEMKTRLPFLLLSLALVALLAACGGGGNSGPVPADAIAQVGSTPITKASFNSVMDVACANYKLQGQTCKVGTPTYASLRASAVNFLVQQEELAQTAKKLGVTVTQKDLDKQVEQIKKAYYKGDDKKFEEALKKQGLTLSAFEQYELLPNLLGQKTKTKVTSNVKVSAAAALAYYKQNKATFTTTSPNRSVRHILVSSKALADKLEKKLNNGADFATLAKQYSKDTGSAQQGGKLLAVKGQLVAPFQKAAFSLKTGQVSQPVHSKFGWHIIQALGPIRGTYTQPFSQLKQQIEGNLANQQTTTAWTAWLAKMASDYKGKVSYQTGYAPPTTTTPTTPAPATTG
jgi:foldase protein PrsA